MEKVAQKVSQILKRPSQEEIPESALPPFKPLPKFQLQRESSLPRIEVDRPHTPSSPKTSLSSRPSSPYPQYQAIAYANTTKTPDYESNRGQKIPPNAKKLRVKSFLWVKPTTTGIDTALYNQLLPVLAANLGSLSSGLALGYSAVLLPQLREAHYDDLDVQHEVSNISTSTGHVYQPFTANPDEGSWIASVFGLGAILGGLMSAFLGNRFGRRVSLMMLTLPDLLGWILVAASQNLWMMIIGRFLLGFTAAGYSPNIQIFVGEISQAKHRGWLSGLTVPIMATGVLLMYTIGSWLPWHMAAACCTPVPCILAISLSFFYDSPYWYFHIGKEKSAHMAIEQFRGVDSNVVSEVFQIQEHVRGETDEITFTEGVAKVFSEKKYFKPFLILNFLFFLMLFSGKFSLHFYAVDIFKKAGSHMNEYLAAVISAFIHLLGALLFIPLVKKFNRKSLLVMSSFFMGLSMILLGICMYTKSHDTMLMPAVYGYDWLPLVSMVVYMIASPIGLCSIPFMYIAEFYPSELRSVLGGLTVAISNLELFIVVKTFPNLENLIGDHGVFWLYAAACFGAIIFTLSYIPETKDKDLTQMNDKFARLRKAERVSPWVSPLPSPSVNSIKKFQYKSQMFTQ